MYACIVCVDVCAYGSPGVAASPALSPHRAMVPGPQAALVIADKDQSLQITGTGDVLEPHDGIIAIGSGSPYALAAARALIDVPGLDAGHIAAKAMAIAADACIYTNHNFTTLTIDEDGTVTETNAAGAGAGVAEPEEEGKIETLAKEP